MKTFLFSAVLLLTCSSQASYQFLNVQAEYECMTNHVFLTTAEGKYLNYTPSTTVVYKPAADDNQNLVIGNQGYIVWVRQLTETEVGLTLMKDINGEMRTIKDINMGSNPVSTVDLDFPIFNPGGEGSAHCKITLRSSLGQVYP